MSEITNANNVLSQYDIGTRVPDEPKSNEMGRNEFLELMIAQMNNQNPLDPQSNEDFVAQLAQFSTVEGIEKMNDGFEDLGSSYRSSQAIQASTLVGSSVTLQGQTESRLMHGDLIYGSAEVPAGSDDLRFRVENEFGQVVAELPLGYQQSGRMDFKWDGAFVEINGQLQDIDESTLPVDEEGNALLHPEGMYTFTVIGNVLGQATNLNVSTSSRVDSVSINSDNTITMNLLGGGNASMSEILNINHVY